jgi:hypothetical protein
MIDLWNGVVALFIFGIFCVLVVMLLNDAKP